MSQGDWVTAGRGDADMTQFEYGLLRGGRLGAATHPLLPPHLIPMLSSISSFLPSALQIGGDKSQPLQQSPTEITQSPTKEDEDMAVDEHGVKKKKERTNEVSCMHPAYRLRIPSGSSVHGGEAPHLCFCLLLAICRRVVAGLVEGCASLLLGIVSSTMTPSTLTQTYPAMSVVRMLVRRCVRVVSVDGYLGGGRSMQRSIPPCPGTQWATSHYLHHVSTSEPLNLVRAPCLSSEVLARLRPPSVP